MQFKYDTIQHGSDSLSYSHRYVSIIVIIIILMLIVSAGVHITSDMNK